MCRAGLSVKVLLLLGLKLLNQTEILLEKKKNVPSRSISQRSPSIGIEIVKSNWNIIRKEKKRAEQVCQSMLSLGWGWNYKTLLKYY